MPIEDVEVEKVNLAFLEEVVVPKDGAVLIADDEADLAKVISFLNIGADHSRGLEVALLTNVRKMQQRNPQEDEVNENDGPKGNHPVLGLHEIFEAIREIVEP